MLAIAALKHARDHVSVGAYLAPADRADSRVLGVCRVTVAAAEQMRHRVRSRARAPRRARRLRRLGGFVGSRVAVRVGTRVGAGVGLAGVCGCGLGSAGVRGGGPSSLRPVAGVHNRVHRLAALQHAFAKRAGAQNLERVTAAVGHAIREELVVVSTHPDQAVQQQPDDRCDRNQDNRVNYRPPFHIVSKACSGRQAQSVHIEYRLCRPFILSPDRLET